MTSAIELHKGLGQFFRKCATLNCKKNKNKSNTEGTKCIIEPYGSTYIQMVILSQTLVLNRNSNTKCIHCVGWKILTGSTVKPCPDPVSLSSAATSKKTLLFPLFIGSSDLRRTEVRIQSLRRGGHCSGLNTSNAHLHMQLH